MQIRVDPQQNELRAIRKVTDWRGRRVLEIGCGDGRLAYRVAGLGTVVTGLDPDEGLIRTARKSLPRRLAGRVHFHIGRAEVLPFPAGSFDVVLFGWAL